MIKNIEKKIRLSLYIAVLSIIGMVVIAIGAIYMYTKGMEKKDDRLYVLDNGIPLLIKRTNMAENRMVEYQSHVNMFHQLFFTIPPDDDFVSKNIESALYLIDDSGLKEYNNLREKDYYGQIMASNASLSISTDSIRVDPQTKKFVYYGTQRVDRKTSVIIRKLVTKGILKETLRSERNPHGCRIENWLTIENTDIKSFKKKIY